MPLKCAYCAEEFTTFYMVNGKSHNGYGNVILHVEKDHPEEWSVLQKALRQFDFDSGLEDLSTTPTDL